MRPPVISVLNGSHWSKEEREERQKLEESIRVDSDRLVPPDFLTDRAKQLYERLAWEMHWIDNLDHADLVMYCYCWDKVQSLMEKNRDVPDTLQGTGSSGQTVLVQNPDRFAFKQYAEEMRKISGKIGISHTDRLRLLQPETPDKPENKFAALKRKRA
jgi:P27 family predicted phage terminase small subunit